VTVLVGPEGGFTEEEIEQFRQYKNILPIQLGPRILRADTAATTAISIIQSMFGDI
jgi:16S rRNA (uracil1498-N3)-methyltransferase